MNTRSTILKAAFGGLIIGMSATAIIFNSALHVHPIIIAVGFLSILCGCFILTEALKGAGK